MIHKWFIIINPVSGNGASKKKWPLIYNELIQRKFDFKYEFTTHKNHAKELIQVSINQGFIKFICIGGDGTLHQMINGILHSGSNNISAFKIGIIPIGTGNDWAKSYGISKNYKKTIGVLKCGNTIKQDIGKITLEASGQTVFFNNLAGIGFDGYVVNKIKKYKKLGFLAYMIGALLGILSFKRSELEFSFDNTIVKSQSFMLLIGLCYFSGGGMRLTNNPNPTDGYFDISHLGNFNFFRLIINIPKLFNGNITQHKLVKNYKTSSLRVKVLSGPKTYIQADGELLGSGNFLAELLSEKINFIVPKEKS